MILLAQGPPPLALIPLPASLRLDAGALPLDRGLRVEGPKDEAATLTDALRADGVETGGRGRKVTMSLVPGMPPEGYRLRVTPDGATIEATTAAGLFYGGQTLRQMIPAPVRGAPGAGMPVPETRDREPAEHGFRRYGPPPAPVAPQRDQGGRGPGGRERREIPCATVEDAPRFAWRGMMLDVSRHFRTVDDVKRIIDLNARLKLNVFHWHLTDDGGWRMEVKAYPELTRRGAWRSYPPKGRWDYRGITFPERRTGGEYGGFYTQGQIRDVVAYAARRHVTVVPEIEMPGHEQAALQCYPWLACDNVPAGEQAVAMCPAKDTTYEFVHKVLDETMALFPSPWIHIGGDEVEKRDWNRSALCQAFMRDHGLKTAEELQSYFTRQVDAYVASKGRRIVGWDEILEGGLAPGATVMSWRGVAGGIAAARAGRDVVMSPTSHLYLDYSYETIPTSKVYAYDPVPPELTAAEARHVLGAQGNVWTERLPDERDVERMAYPREAALAEAAWTPLARKSWPDFSLRLDGLLGLFDRLGVAYHVDPPSVEPSAYLTDERVRIELPRARPGWGVAVGTGARPDSIMRPEAGDPGYVMAAPGTTTTLWFARLSDRVLSPPARVAVGGAGRASVAGLKAGLTAESRTGTFTGIPNVGWEPIGTATAIDLSKRPAPEKFALRFFGYIRLPKDGDYAFTLTSDDGSVLRIGGLTVVDNDGEHAASPKTGTVRAKAGVYPFELGYFDAGGANSLSLKVDGAPVPADWLWH